VHERSLNRILVVGGSGFLGLATLAALEGVEVHSTYFHHRAQLEDVTWHALDLMDSAATAALVESVRPSHLIALGWQLSDRDHLEMAENLDWVRATLHLARVFAATGGTRAVFAGTYAEYGVAEGILDESRAPQPVSLYAVCKDAIHRVIARAAVNLGISYAWARMFTVYGPHDADYRLIPYTLQRLLKGDEVRTTEGRQVRDFIHVADAGRALAMLATSDLTGPVNVGSGQGHPVREVVELLGEATGRSELLRIGAVQQAHGETQRIVADVQRLRNIGWSPQFDLRSGLAETVDWYRSRA